MAWLALAPSGEASATQTVSVPELSALAKTGKVAFDATCAQCHGTNGSGTDKGPPLIHRIYNPGHHGDESFRRAVRNGVQRHHWNFGDMPAQPKVTDRQVEEIIAFVRAVQTANGIIREEHNM